MASISLCMIVKNEEEVLGRCLDSVKSLVDEIIIVDTGSSDRTKQAAGEYTEHIYDFPWQDDFSAARNFAFSKGRMKYLMWMDADDILPPEEAVRFTEMKQQLKADVVMMPYVTAFDETGKASFLYYRERIVRNHAGYFFSGKVHEVIPPSGQIFYSDIRIEHRKIKIKEGGRRNLRIYEQMEKEGGHFDSRALYYYGRELRYHRMYKKGASILEQFFACPDAWLENRIDAARQLSACYYAMGEEEKAFLALLKTFMYDVPRGEICCDIGKHFQDRGKYEQAVFWYEQALNAEKNISSGAFVDEDCYGFFPAISLCVCWDRLGDRRKAEKYNELAGKFRPQSPYYLANREFFRSR